MKSNKGQKSNRSKKNKEKDDKLVKVGIILITIIFIFIIYKIFNIIVENNKKIDLSGDTYYQYFYGICKEYSGKIEVITKDDQKQLILENDNIVYLDSTPIYYKETLGKVLLPNRMEVVYPDKGTIYKLNEFTNIIQDSNVMYAKKYKKDNTKGINNTFLYDGDDLYFFLEETTITIGKSKYKLSPLSYAIVNYRQNVELYDYNKDEYIIIDESELPTDDVIAVNKNKDYTINMSVDSFSTGSTDQLLIKNIDYLNELDY